MVRFLPLLASLILLPTLVRAADPPPAAPATRPSLPGTWGVNIHFTAPLPGEAKMLADAGVAVVRTDFAWGRTERRPGAYDFGPYDGLVRALESHGIRPLFILDYGNRLYDDGLAPHTDAGRAAFAAWAAAAATHFKGRGVIWELWNEPNLKQFWKPVPSAADYATLAVATAKAVRVADPDATIVGPAASTVDLPYLETCFKGGLLDHLSAVTVHPYRGTEPESAAKDFRALRDLIARYAPKGKAVPIFSGEWGYSSVVGGVDEATQARYLPRQWLSNLANDVSLSVWYDWRDDGTDPKEHEHHFGTVRQAPRPGGGRDGAAPFEPKPAYLAMRTLTAQLAGYAFSKRIAVGDPEKDYVLLFAKSRPAGETGTGPADVALAVWTTRPGEVELEVPASPGTFRVTGHLGESEPDLVGRSSGVRVKATQAVRYLKPGEPNALLHVAAAWERLPLDLRARAEGGGTTIRSRVANPLDTTARLAVAPRGAGVPSPEAFAPRSEREVTVPHVPLSRDPEPQVVTVDLHVEGVGVVSQWAAARATNPVRLTRVGAVGDDEIVTVENLSADPLEGRLSLRVEGRAGGEPPAVPVTVAAGGRVTARLAATGADGRRYPSFGLGLSDGARSVVSVPTAAYTPLADAASPAGTYRLSVDGDKKVKSEQTLSIAEPPAGPLAEGVKGMALTYRFDAGHKFVQVMPATAAAKALQGRPRELRVWVYGDNTGNVARMRYAGADGQTFQPDGVRLDWSGWRLVTFRLDGTGAAHWGGKNDGVPAHPLRLDTLLLVDNATKEATGGTLYFAAPTAVE
ncbi:MAG: hypothetical protein JWO31_2681 [Phycisphaerales bacterium]|nr:hypothetical protein [Phycisphaerales bacterium]